MRAAVEAAMPQLRHALAESGINRAEQRGRRVHPAMAAAGATAGFQRRGRSSYAEHHGGDGAAAEGVSAPAALQRMASAVNGVDIFA